MLGLYSKTSDCEDYSFQKHACNLKRLYIKAFFLKGIKEKRGTSKALYTRSDQTDETGPSVRFQRFTSEVA